MTSLIELGRAIAGFAVGMLTMIVPMYMSEVSTAGIRGTLVVLQQLSITLGILVSYWLEYGTQYIGGTRCAPDIPYTGGTPSERTFDPYNDVGPNGCTGQSDAAWRVPFALQIFPGLVLGIGMLFFPESPRYYCMRDNEEEGIKALARVRRTNVDDNLLQMEYLSIKAEVIFEESFNREKFPGKTGVSLYLAGYTTLFSTWPSFRRTAIGCCVMFFQQFIGCNAIIYYAPTIFGQLGLSGTTSGLLATGVYGKMGTTLLQMKPHLHNFRYREHTFYTTCTIFDRQDWPEAITALRCCGDFHLPSDSRRYHRRLWLHTKGSSSRGMDGYCIRLYLRCQFLVLLGTDWLGSSI